MIDEVLRNAGLTENETKVYLALLETGETTATQIIRVSNIGAGRVYEVMDSLKKKGMISEITKNKVKHYSAANPKKILDYLEKKKHALSIQEDEVKKIIPDILGKMSSLTKRTKIEIYTGYEGMVTAYNKELIRHKKNTEVLVLGVQEDQQYDKKTMSYFKNILFKKRVQNGIRVRKINDKKSKATISDEQATIRYLAYPSITTINIIEDLTIIGLFGDEEIIITIEDEKVATNFKTYFEFLWKMAKK